MKSIRFMAMVLLAFLLLPVIGKPLESGKKMGETLPPYHPLHVTGPDQGTDTCPV